MQYVGQPSPRDGGGRVNGAVVFKVPVITPHRLSVVTAFELLTCWFYRRQELRVESNICSRKMRFYLTNFGLAPFLHDVCLFGFAYE
jgi:hypothetical protein